MARSVMFNFRLPNQDRMIKMPRKNTANVIKLLDVKHLKGLLPLEIRKKYWLPKPLTLNAWVNTVQDYNRLCYSIDLQKVKISSSTVRSLIIETAVSAQEKRLVRYVICVMGM